MCTHIQIHVRLGEIYLFAYLGVISLLRGCAYPPCPGNGRGMGSTGCLAPADAE